ncbi:hypothetical protein KO566_05360 [Flavobacteriaceae bacterium XHP0103]|uniref:hypothetical protein n=1 Tax=Marixanthotalea marina TaxID=2844359 RepID=UPI002989D253|nr:hypothetical protein [Marixanthotalea marina]MBU3821480.1 hypothetical protein [Marixanthotalea marina]
MIYLTTITLFLSCESNNTIDCSAVSCLAAHVSVNLINKTTNENFVLENNITKESIVIRNTENNELEFDIIESNGLLYILKKNVTDTYEISLNSEVISIFSFETTPRDQTKCCGFGKLKNVSVEEHEFEVEDNLITIYL